MHRYQCTNANAQYQATYLEAVHARRGLGHGQGRGHGSPRTNATAAVPRANATAAAPRHAPVTGAHPQGVPAGHPARRGVINSGVSLLALRQAAGSIAAAGGSAAAAAGVAGGSGSGGTDATSSGGGVAGGGGSGGGDVRWPGYVGLQPGYAGFQPRQLSDALDTSLPLPGVCATQSCWVQGALVFALISACRRKSKKAADRRHPAIHLCLGSAIPHRGPVRVAPRLLSVLREPGVASARLSPHIAALQTVTASITYGYSLYYIRLQELPWLRDLHHLAAVLLGTVLYGLPPPLLAARLPHVPPACLNVLPWSRLGRATNWWRLGGATACQYGRLNAELCAWAALRTSENVQTPVAQGEHRC